MPSREPQVSRVVRRIPRRTREPFAARAGRWIGFVGLLVVALGIGAGMLMGGSSVFSAVANLPPVRSGAATVDPFASLQPFQTRTPEPPLPTLQYLPPPTPTPLSAAAVASGPSLNYVTGSGDTLRAVAARFGVNPANIQGPASGLVGETTLADGQLLVIPAVLDENLVGPRTPMMPDSEVVFGPTAFDAAPQVFAEQRGGYLARYRGYAESSTMYGGDLVLHYARQHSINPRILLAMIEYTSGWVTDPEPSGERLTKPLGWDHPYRDDLGPQLNWAANQLSIGYYGWRAGTLTTVTLTDGTVVRLAPDLNAGTVALQFVYAQIYGREAWERVLGPDGLVATYTTLFGPPDNLAVRNLIPANLQQPPLRLPFRAGSTWAFTGGPHPAWIQSGQWSALDFAPPSSGCSQSFEPVTAMAAGQIVRAADNAVILDLDGDGREGTGWTIFYFHIAARGMIESGTFVQAGDPIGFPSCEGGRSTGTHTHIARRFNGEWMPVNGIVPFNIAGYVAAIGSAEYQGSLTRDGYVIEACTCSAPYTLITADP